VTYTYKSGAQYNVRYCTPTGNSTALTGLAITVSPAATGGDFVPSLMGITIVNGNCPPHDQG
jgi:hypothetical protein